MGVDGSRRCASKHPRATHTGTDLAHNRLAENMYMTASRLVTSACSELNSDFCTFMLTSKQNPEPSRSTTAFHLSLNYFHLSSRRQVGCRHSIGFLVADSAGQMLLPALKVAES